MFWLICWLVSKYSLNSLKKFVVVANYYKIYYALGHLDDEEHLAIIQQLPVEIMKEIFNLVVRL